MAAGKMYLAWSSNEEILRKADCGGAVTSLLNSALESKIVDKVLVVKKMGDNRYDGVLSFTSNSKDITDAAGSLHCVTPNIAKSIKNYLDGAWDTKIGVVCKPCDARAIVELAKRKQINSDNLLIIGVNCTGTIQPVKAKEMLQKEYKVNPDDVAKEDIDDGILTITLKTGEEIKRDLQTLEEKGYGRRENCRRCEIHIPTMADLACGKWGAPDKKITFIEVRSEKGQQLIEKSIEGGYIKFKEPNHENIESREMKIQEAVENAKIWQQKDFDYTARMSNSERFEYWQSQFNKCEKCYGCRDACPICFCKSCRLEADRGLVKGGELPPSRLFPLVRLSHVADSCINCGQCQDVCPAELPTSRLYHMLNKELSTVFQYESGMSISTPPPLATVGDKIQK